MAPPKILPWSVAGAAVKRSVESIKGCELCLREQVLEDILFETANFYVALDISPIREGHLMIISNEHFGSAGELPDYLRKELLALKNNLRDLVETTYNKTIFYEHGRAGHCLKLKDSEVLCNHFHLHAVPTNTDIHELLIKDYPAMKLSSYADIFHMYDRYGSYLYFENNDSEMYFYPASDENVAPHLLRSLLCKKLKTPKKSDWDKYRNQKELEAARNNYIKNFIKEYQ